MRAKGGIRVAPALDLPDAGNSDADVEEEDEDIEATYERRPRPSKPEWEKKESNRLPVRGDDGRLRVLKTEGEPWISNAKEDDAEEKEEEVLEPQIGRGERLRRAKEKLADIASTIIEDPEKNIGALKVLRTVGDDKDLEIKKLAFLTQLAVYKDIIPGYRIRSITEKEESTKVSKDVKRLRQYEEGLLTNYQAYLQALENAIQG
ncbi:nucleolar complex-associated protein-domain-containing protein [Blyttiomyces helicus]|uniref:Nucleolar complex-associated protein-domain-containing protein n=1 Tax=Blyttiomyces helicus TaxID=388810 RepID=A0A4P9WGC0_9FUNG|nr:nucleolar complex-associated protein-domain-containing protein [Blyttiomyces helicus]|eukprot:RKO91382.1 nucleolar complex-associated protein-domain-containing protein [Blyttiomyces helicus]